MSTNPDPNATIDFADLAVHKAVKAAYDQARIAGLDQFEYRGQAILTEYAYYLLEWAADQTKRPELRPQRPASKGS